MVRLQGAIRTELHDQISCEIYSTAVHGVPFTVTNKVVGNKVLTQANGNLRGLDNGPRKVPDWPDWAPNTAPESTRRLISTPV